MANVLEINSQKLDSTLIMGVEGRIDTTTSPQFEEAIKSSIEGISALVLDFAKVEYISSAGLRVLLSTQKAMAKQGGMSLRNVSDEINEIFEVTGFSDILTIE